MKRVVPPQSPVPPYQPGIIWQDDEQEAPLLFSEEPPPVRPANPVMMLQVSRDGGETFQSAVMRPLGATGKYRQLVRWHRLGQSRNLVLRFVLSDPVPFTALDIQVQAE